MDNKFRIWDNKENKWLFGYEYKNLGGFSLLGETVLFGEIGSEIDIKRLNDYIIEQFTGLKDKNGAEIYEGDIIEFYLHCNPVGSSYDKHIGVIVYEYGCFYIEYNSFWVNDNPCKRLLEEFYYSEESRYVPNVGDVYDRSEIPKNELSIIGNIHQNNPLRLRKTKSP